MTSQDSRMRDFDLIVLVWKQELSHRSIVTITGTSTFDMIVELILFAEIYMLHCCVQELSAIEFHDVVGLPKTHVCHSGAIEVFWN